MKKFITLAFLIGFLSAQIQAGQSEEGITKNQEFAMTVGGQLVIVVVDGEWASFTQPATTGKNPESVIKKVVGTGEGAHAIEAENCGNPRQKHAKQDSVE